jgi:putative transposase
MPDHAHLLLTPASNISLEKAMQYIKGNFSFRIKSKLDVWERSYDSRRIDDANDYTTCATYIHQNPIRANLVSHASLYPHSSANPTHPFDGPPIHFSKADTATMN